jgi:hypothetical protein
MSISITVEGRFKASAHNDNSRSARDLSLVQQYAIRALARRGGISIAHAMVAAQLAGIVREGAQHG